MPDLQPMPDLSPAERAAVLAAWGHRLRTRDRKRQGHRRLRDLDGCLCALGELADELAQRGYAAWVMTGHGSVLAFVQPDGEPETVEVLLPPALLRPLGLDVWLTSHVASWNDLGHPWPEIAGRITRSLPA